MEISEKEFAVIREISDNHLPDQRTIATRTGFSLGLTNLIIKRLINKGYIKAKQLNQKKIQYLLTPKGFSEKAKKSYTYTLKTISAIKTMREKIRERVLAECEQGPYELLLTGNNELADIAELAIRGLNDPRISLQRASGNPGDHDSVILAIKGQGKDISLDILDYLVKSGLFFSDHKVA